MGLRSQEDVAMSETILSVFLGLIVEGAVFKTYRLDVSNNPVANIYLSLRLYHVFDIINMCIKVYLQVNQI